MKAAIVQSNYLPWKGYFDIINMVDLFIFYDDVQYTKRDWRNRNRIKTRDGIKWLTVPALLPPTNGFVKCRSRMPIGSKNIGGPSSLIMPGPNISVNTDLFSRKYTPAGPGTICLSSINIPSR